MKLWTGIWSISRFHPCRSLVTIPSRNNFMLSYNSRKTKRRSTNDLNSWTSSIIVKGDSTCVLRSARNLGYFIVPLYSFQALLWNTICYTSVLCVCWPYRPRLPLAVDSLCSTKYKHDSKFPSAASQVVQISPPSRALSFAINVASLLPHVYSFATPVCGPVILHSSRSIKPTKYGAFDSPRPLVLSLSRDSLHLVSCRSTSTLPSWVKAYVDFSTHVVHRTHYPLLTV